MCCIGSIHTNLKTPIFSWTSFIRNLQQCFFSTTPALAAGDLHSLFEGFSTKWPELEPVVVSTEPWIVTFDNFMNESETDALIEAVGAESGGPGFVRSTDTGDRRRAFTPFLVSTLAIRSSRSVLLITDSTSTTDL